MADLSELAATFRAACKERDSIARSAPGYAGTKFARQADGAAHALAHEIVNDRNAQAAWIDGQLYIVTASVDPHAHRWTWEAKHILILNPEDIVARDF